MIRTSQNFFSTYNNQGLRISLYYLIGRKYTSRRNRTLDSKEMAILSARIAENKKAEDIVILDVREFTFITDFFVICSGFNERQLQSIANDIEEKMYKRGVHRKGIEGYNLAKWILLDYGDIVIHLFDKEKRHFYDLELLWGDAPKLKWKRD